MGSLCHFYFLQPDTTSSLTEKPTDVKQKLGYQCCGLCHYILCSQTLHSLRNQLTQSKKWAIHAAVCMCHCRKLTEKPTDANQKLCHPCGSMYVSLHLFYSQTLHSPRNQQPQKLGRQCGGLTNHRRDFGHRRIPFFSSDRHTFPVYS